VHSRGIPLEASEMKIIDRLVDTFTGARRIRAEAAMQPSGLLRLVNLVRARAFLAITGRQLMTETSQIGYSSLDLTEDDPTRLSPLRRLARKGQ
jgi:hypothetical protein